MQWGKREEGEGKQGKGKGKQGKVEGEEQEKVDQQRFPLSSSSSKLLRLFLRAIAPFTGTCICLVEICIGVVWE